MNTIINQELIDHENINQLTEHKNNYKQFNVALMDAYVCIKPDCLSKICCSLFNCIVSTKLYHHPDSPAYKESEDKRIYSNILLTPEILLHNYDPYKYKSGSNDMSRDIGNFVKRLQQINDMNIFYMWRYGRPYLYMFIMERDIGIWKIFNSQAFVSPRTMKKILSCSSHMISTMQKICQRISRSINNDDLHNSFGKFINSMLYKMNPEVFDSLPFWKSNGNLFDYIHILQQDLSQLEPYAGVGMDAELMKKLPNSIINKLPSDSKSKDKKHGGKMDIATLTNDLVPADENLVTIKPKKHKKVAKNKSIEAKKESSRSSNPFLNCNNMMRFYLAFLQMHDEKAKVYSFESERSYAIEFMDMLKILGRLGDKEFLKSFIKYFIDNHLTGNNIYKPDRTSMKMLKEILPVYHRKYIS